jgi:hypothetical protein
MSLKSLSLNFEQLENKIALSALPNSGYRDLGRKAHPTQQIVRQAKKPPLQIQTVPFNAIKPTVAININESKPVIQNKPLTNTTTIVPIKFVQNITPDGNIRCSSVSTINPRIITPSVGTISNIGPNIQSTIRYIDGRLICGELPETWSQKFTFKTTQIPESNYSTTTCSENNSSNGILTIPSGGVV